MRIHNFNAGPSALPLDVLIQAQQELLDYQGLGYSVLEMSHRSAEFQALLEAMAQDLRALLQIPKNYLLLFCHGGARQQFAMVPMNLLRQNPKADYIVSGTWSELAYAEAQKYGDIHLAAKPETAIYSDLPAPTTWKLRPDARYVHYTSNETIHGIEFHYIPETHGIPLVADMSSNLLTRPFEVSAYGLIYAAAQKNFGPAGLTLVIMREDLLDTALPSTPGLMDYRKQVQEHSLYNTPPTFSWYLSSLVLQWMKREGGLSQLEIRNKEKAERLYAYIDQSDFYFNHVAHHARSRMNIPFTLKNTDLEQTFLQEAKSAGIVGLKGHSSLGGMRASLYNAVSMHSVLALIEFMDTFKRKH